MGTNCTPKNSEPSKYQSKFNWIKKKELEDVFAWNNHKSFLLNNYYSAKIYSIETYFKMINPKWTAIIIKSSYAKLLYSS